MLATGLIAAAPGAALGSSYRFSGRNATGWSWAELPGGGSRDVGVFVADSSDMWRVPGDKPGKYAGSGLTFYVGDFMPGDPDVASDNVFRMIELSISPFDAGINRDLTTARAAGSWEATVTEWVGEPPAEPDAVWEPTSISTTPVTMDLTWEGMGPLIRDIWSSKSFSDDFMSVSHGRRTYRDATIGGSVGLPEMGLTFDGASFDAELSNDAGGSVSRGEFPW